MSTIEAISTSVKVHSLIKNAVIMTECICDHNDTNKCIDRLNLICVLNV